MFKCSVHMYTFKNIGKNHQKHQDYRSTKPLRRVCNGTVIEQFKEDYSELLVHLYFESEVNLND